MAKKQELNTSCTATFKDGHSEIYSSIEEASEKTGLSVSSIKIRCNKPGSGGKDKTTFIWNDDFTRRHYQAKKSKNKGASLEAEVVNRLKEIGYIGCCRSAGESRFADNNKIDIVDRDGKLPINIQCKNTQNTPNYFAIRDACTDKSKPFALVWKKAAEGGCNSLGTVVIINIELFYKLMQLWKKNLN